MMLRACDALVGVKVAVPALNWSPKWFEKLMSTEAARNFPLPFESVIKSESVANFGSGTPSFMNTLHSNGVLLREKFIVYLPEP